MRIEQPYYIAIHETTNAQYQKFFEAAGEAKAGSRWQAASRKWAAPQKLDPVKNHLPVTNVSIEQAQAFCAWLGGQLADRDRMGMRGPRHRRQRLSAPVGQRMNRIANAAASSTANTWNSARAARVPVEQLAAGANPLGLMHAIGNAAEWCQDSEQRGGFILRGCSIATANINDVRVTWRAKGDAKGEESTGFRVVVPIADAAAASDSPPKTAAVSRTPPAPNNPEQPASAGFLSSLPWGKIVNAITSPSTGSSGGTTNHSISER